MKMATKKLQKNFKILFKFLIILETYTFALITCPKEIMFQIGVTSRCESETGMTIPCDGTHKLPVKKTYIDCNEGHFNGGQEILTCDFDTGLWSKNPVRCFSHCALDPSATEIKLSDNKTASKWYAEILKRPPINGEENVFPGVILSSRLIMTLEKYFDPNIKWSVGNFVARTYRPDGQYTDYLIDHIEYKTDPVYSNDGTPKLDRMCMFVLSHQNYIKIDELTRPTCLGYDGKDIIADNRWFIEVMRAKPEYNLRPTYIKQCTVPHVGQKTELFCYSDFKSDALKTCPINVNILQTKCPIGYEKVNANGNDVLSTCVGNRWIIDGQGDTDCKLICGDIGNDASTPIPLIFQATQTDIKNAPWHVGIYSNNTIASSSYELICSGSIIHKNIVISAAHCFYNKQLRKIDDHYHYLVGAGKRKYSYKMSERSEQFVRVKDIQTLKFDIDSLKNDIAVLSVAPDFTFSQNIKPVCIEWADYEDWELENRTTGYIFGWGATSDRDVLNPDLATAALQTVSSEECKSLHNKVKVTDENFCGISNKGSTACRGDSGGGFVIKKKFGSTERYFLWGVISSGIADDYCSDGGVTIFTNIQNYKERLEPIISKSRRKLNSDNISKILYHQIYAHNLWTPLTWVEKEMNSHLRNKS